MSNHVGKTGAVRNTTRSPEEGGPGVGTDHFVLLPRIWQLRHNFSAYDAAYIVLAEKPALPWSRGTHDWLLPRAMRRPLSCFEPAAMGSSAITGVPHPSFAFFAKRVADGSADAVGGTSLTSRFSERFFPG